MDNLRIGILTKENYKPFENYILPLIRRKFLNGEDITILGAANESYALGALAFTIKNDVLEVLSIYVDEKMRRQGIASEMFLQLRRILDANRIEPYYAIVDFMIEEGTGEDIFGLLKSLGFNEPAQSGRLFRFTSEPLHDHPLVGPALKLDYIQDKHILPFAAITKEQFEEIEADEEVLDFLRPSRYKDTNVNNSVIWVEDGHVLGWMLGSLCIDDGVIIGATSKRKGASEGCFKKMLQAFINNWYVFFGHDYVAYTYSLTDKSVELSTSIAGDTIGEFGSFYCDTQNNDESFLVK